MESWVSCCLRPFRPWGHLALWLLTTLGRFFYSTLGLRLYIPSSLHPKILFPGLQGTRSFSVLPLKGVRSLTLQALTASSSFVPTTTLSMVCKHCCAYLIPLLSRTEVGSFKKWDGFCSLLHLYPQCLTHHRHSVNPCWMRSKVKEKQEGRKETKQAGSQKRVSLGFYLESNSGTEL